MKPTNSDTLEEILRDFMSKVSYEQYRTDHAPNDEATLANVKRSKNLYVQEALTALAEREERLLREAVYGFHEYIIGKDIIQQEYDQAFNYGRLHKALDAYISELTKESKG